MIENHITEVYVELTRALAEHGISAQLQTASEHEVILALWGVGKRDGRHEISVLRGEFSEESVPRLVDEARSRLLTTDWETRRH